MLSRFSRLRDYQEFMHVGIEKGVLDFYQVTYQRPVLGNRDFIKWVKAKLGDRARVEEHKPESR